MKYTINYRISGDFLTVELEGSYPLEKFRDISALIDTIIDSNNINKILVDLRNFKGRFGVFDGLNHIEKFREESRFLKFAILDLPENKQPNDFFENASYNRGFTLLFFYDEAEARKWLQVEDYAPAEKNQVKEI
jgi:hypothetical protein